jgi:hypothetical protein
MTAGSLRARLAAGTAVGAGVLTTLMEWGEGLDRPALTFDTDADGHPAWAPVTLREPHRLAAVRAAVLHAAGIGRRDPVAVCAPAAVLSNSFAFGGHNTSLVFGPSTITRRCEPGLPADAGPPTAAVH